MIKNEKTSDIDFVITWVDGGDPEWQKLKQKYEPKKSGGGVLIAALLDIEILERLNTFYAP